MSAPSGDGWQNAPLTPGSRRPQYIVQYIGQPRRIAGGGSVARGNTVQRQCTRRHPAKAEPCPRLPPRRLPPLSTAFRGLALRGAITTDGVPTGQEVSERPRPRPRGGNRGLALTGLDALARLHSRLHDSGPARRGVAPAAAWTVADALPVAGVAAGAACWAPRIDAAARSLQFARVTHHPADVVAFAEVAPAWLAKARAVLAKRHRPWGARRACGAGRSSVLPSPALSSVAAFHGVAAPPVVAPAPPQVVGDGVGWGAVDHLSEVDMVHMPAEMSMETAVPIDFQQAWAEAQHCVNERVLAAVAGGR
eukprot:jgi/Tetstr1/448091/TSEL_035390.t1